ncbi:hypothetical protein ACHAWO_005333 [Cyclotella atomus]|jgi:hypothetical protein|uniref:Uncharacterized protein n=1 Tax=Cyclotella atomus TaxID=382360 RepID=A0ABD3QWH0_9STRA
MHRARLVIGDVHREEVKVLEVVFASFGWGLVSSAWGASVTSIICDNLDLHLILRHLHPMAQVMLSSNWLVQQHPPTDLDVIVSSANSSAKLSQLCELLQVIPSKVVLLSVPDSISGRVLLSSVGYPALAERFTISVSSLTHRQFGGATPALWRFALLSTRDLNWKHPPISKKMLPPVFIFNMIDDKIGGGFKPIPQRAYKTL